MARLQLVSFGLLICCGFRPCSSLRAPLLSDELGCSPTLSILIDRARYLEEDDQNKPFFYFDPLEFARDDNFARLREAELKHGRICMCALTEIIFVPILRRISGVEEWIPALRKCSESVLYNNPVKGMDLFKVIAVCGYLEAFVFIQQDPQDLPGDYGTGFFGVRDYGLHEDKLVVELEHGRLAMLAFVGFLASDAVTGGEPWLEQWLGFFEAWGERIAPTGL